MPKLPLFFFLLLLSGALYAQESESQSEDMNTDRPSKGDAAKAVAPGTLQLETGFFYQQDKSNHLKDREFHYPEAALRIGVFKRTELRFRAQLQQNRFGYEDGGPNIYLPKPGPGKNFGVGEIDCGFKFQLIENDKEDAGFFLAFQAETTLPIESEDYRTRIPEPTFKLAAQKQLNKHWYTFANLGLELQDAGGEHHQLNYGARPAYTFAFGYLITENFAVFTEANGRQELDEHFQHGLDAGFAWRFHPDVQWDAFGGIGLTEEAPDFFLNTGISYRFKK